jgi:hypothetical protein
MIKYETKEQREKKVSITVFVLKKHKQLLIELGENSLSRGVNVLIKSNEKFIEKHIKKYKKLT